MKFRTQYNFVQTPGEEITGPSLTVPDMSMSIREIFQRFASGLPLTYSNKLTYTGDDYTPDLRGLDLVEIEQLYENAAGDIQQYQNDLSELIKQREKEQQPTNVEKEQSTQ